MFSSATVEKQKRRRGLRLLLLGGLIAAGLALGAEIWRVVLGANLHEVLPGRLYRGAQPSAAMVAKLAARYHIRTIVNLRGACDPADWFTEEINATERLHMSQEDVCMASGRLPADQELRKLVDVFDHAEHPLYLHCRRGADRTGVASTIYLLLETDTPFAEARRQLGLRYGHVAVGRTGLMDDFLDLYATWLRDGQKEHAPERFRHWLLNVYHGAGYDYRIDSFVPSGAAKVRAPLGFTVRVRNTGSKPWQLRSLAAAGFKLGFCVRDERDSKVADGWAGLLDAVVKPGEAIELALIVPPVTRTGRYRVTLDMVHPDLVWFYQMGSEPFEEELVIRE